MQYTKLDDIQISRMTLGTAQLGMDYGIANTNGKPTPEKSHDILALAKASGINCLDTAPAYGNSHEIIGSFGNGFYISTKISGLTETDYYSEISQSIKNSLQQLKIQKLDFCMLHKAADMNLDDGEPVRVLADLKKKGLLRYIGASIYTPDDVHSFLEHDELDVIQVPLNLFDHRLLQAGLLEELSQARKIIFTRSIFLQGLPLMEVSNVPDYLSDAIPFIEELDSLSIETGRSKEELALVFVRDITGIASLVIGVETCEQLDSNIKLMSTPAISDSVRDRILDVFGKIPLHVLDPSKWESLK